MATAEKVAIRQAQATEDQAAAVRALDSHLKRLEKKVDAMAEQLSEALAAMQPKPAKEDKPS